MSASHPRTLLGFDFGTTCIGVAIGQELTGQARPLEAVQVKQHKPDWAHISLIMDQWQPQLLIVGLPNHLDGTEQNLTQLARRFGNQLNGRYNLPVQWQDERLTTVEARLLLQDEHPDKAEIDMMAATLILQSWLDEHARQSS